MTGKPIITANYRVSENKIAFSECHFVFNGFRLSFHGSFGFNLLFAEREFGCSIKHQIRHEQIVVVRIRNNRTRISQAYTLI